MRPRGRRSSVGLTAQEVYADLGTNNFISALGNTKGQSVQVTLTASTNLHTAQEFGNLILKQANGAIIRLKDVGTVELGGIASVAPAKPLAPMGLKFAGSIGAPLRVTPATCAASVITFR